MLVENTDPNDQQMMQTVNKGKNVDVDMMAVHEEEEDDDDFLTSKRVRVATKLVVHDQFTQSSKQLQNNSHLQYSDLYHARMEKLAPCCRVNCKKKWENERECERIASLSSLIDSTDGDDDVIMAGNTSAAKGPSKNNGSAIAWVVGTAYVDLPLKECVLDEITREQWVSAPPPRAKYVDPAQDKVILEDESGRVVLAGEKLSRFLVCTGMDELSL